MQVINASVILDSRHQRKDGTYAVKLRITHQRKQKYFPITSLTKEDWEKVITERPRGTFKETKLYFQGLEAKAYELASELNPFTFDAFEKRFTGGRVNRKDALELMQVYIDELTEQERTGTAYSYSTALKSIRKFLQANKAKSLPLTGITPDWLRSYEKWMIENGKSITTVGMYLRSLRVVVNMGIEEGSLLPEAYPFGKRKYQIPSGQNIKKALGLADIKKIVMHEPASPAEAKARDLWLFSYLCNGINVKDIARLKYKAIDDETIQFLRSKTERSTRQNLKPVLVALLPETKLIIEKWGAKPMLPENLVFDLVSLNVSAEKEAAQIKQAAKTINKYMKRVGEACGIKAKITTYTARHSYATVQKLSGASMEYISESLGHKDLRTTENYLASFEEAEMRERQQALLNF